MSEDITLCGFLENTGAQLRFYDMGRRISEIPRDDFLAFEKTTLPYPQPMQQKAWLALIQQRERHEEPVVWFLRFELDEQGKLVLATRDYFIHRFIELAGNQQADTDLAAALQDNPFTFKPREDKLANLHAIIHRDLGLPPSQYFEHARDYFAGKLGWDQWTFVGFQGIADLAARKSEPHVCRLLAESVQHLPDEPLIALSQCLEHHAVGGLLGPALLARLHQALESESAGATLVAALLRGLSQAESGTLSEAIASTLNNDAACNPEILAAIGGRAWQALGEPDVAKAYLERLAAPCVNPQVFQRCVGDLLRLPGMQQHILGVLRGPDRSERLAAAFQTMLGSQQ